MKRAISAIVATVVVLGLNTAVGQQRIVVTGNRMVVGGYFSSGFSFVAGDGYEDLSGWPRGDRKAKWAGDGGAYFDFFFTDLIGIEAGLGFRNKGIRFRDGDVGEKSSIVYMEIPVMAKLTFKGFQAALGLAFLVGLSGKTTTWNEDVDVKDRWDGDDWQYFHRVNLGPKLVVGYAIPVGPIYIVPGMSWSMHFINDLNNDEIEDLPLVPDDPEYRMRAVNLMFRVAVEWPIPR